VRERAGQLHRGGAEPRTWINERSPGWRAGVKWATLDLSAAFRSAFVATLPDATLVAGPFHVVKHANSKLDECRRRVQNETLGHRGRKTDPLFRSRRLLTMAKQRLNEDAEAKMVGLLKAGDPKGEVATSWHAKEAVRELYAHADEATAAQWIDQLIVDMADRRVTSRRVVSLGQEQTQRFRDLATSACCLPMRAAAVSFTVRSAMDPSDR